MGASNTDLSHHPSSTFPSEALSLSLSLSLSPPTVGPTVCVSVCVCVCVCVGACVRVCVPPLHSTRAPPSPNDIVCNKVMT